MVEVAVEVVEVEAREIVVVVLAVVEAQEMAK